MELTVDQALQQGVAAHKAGKLQEAEKLYNAILKSRPDHPDANHNLGVLGVGVGKVELALPYFKKALESNSKVEQYWVSYIDALIKLGQLDHAKQILQQAEAAGLKGEKLDQLEGRLVGQVNSNISIDDRNTPSKREIDKLASLYNKGNLQEALILGDELASRFSKDSNIAYIMGGICKALGKYNEAISHYRKAVQLLPQDFALWNRYGFALSVKGDQKGAMDCYLKAVDLNPAFPGVYLNIAKAGELKKGDHLFENAIAIAKSSNVDVLDRASILFALGLSLDFGRFFFN